MKSTTLASPFDPNSPQITTTNARRHNQMKSKLAKPYREDVGRIIVEILHKSKNEQPKVHFLLVENDQPLHIKVDTLGYSESEYHQTCYLYAIANQWIRTNHSDIDKGYFRTMFDITRDILQRRKANLLVVVVNGYICEGHIISPIPSPKGFGV